MKKLVFLPCVLILLLSSTQICAQSRYHDLNHNHRMDSYENPALPIPERVEDLVSQMTLPEKVGQLQMTMGWGYYESDGTEIHWTDAFERAVTEQPIGSMWALMRADPWTQKDFQNGLTPQQAHQLTNAMQRYVREHTRLGIPLLFAEECPHGHMALGTTVFPTALGRASSFNAELEYRIGAEVGRQAALQGVQIAFGPVVDIARDPRWSRMEEGYGEDPVLSAMLGSQYALGLQSQGLLSTLKHFTAYGVSEGGHNGASAHVGARELLSILSYPFFKAAQSGVRAVMTAYNDVDGVPCSSNKWLIQDVLRDTWHFDGLVISDLFAINGLVSSRIAENAMQAAAMAAQAGVNIDLGATCYAQPLVDAIHHGLITEKTVDSLLKPILLAKFQLGLFDKDYDDKPTCIKQSDLALESATESIVLLKNEGALLPLSSDYQRIAVIGPNADNVYNMLGDYTAPQRDTSVVTLLEGLREALPEANIDYVRGCAIRDTSYEEISRAVAAAQAADVIVLALGGSSARDFHTHYQETGAADAAVQTVSDMESGEGFDRSSLSLMGYQQQLLEAVCATGKPVVLVLIQGRPLNIEWAAQHVPAILCAWYPGLQGGRAIANLLLGKSNPSGHLPVSYPRNEGQLPVYYNTTSVRRDYTDAPATPLFPFGYGLSYTTFYYSNGTIDPLPDGRVQVTVEVQNTGNCDGVEVVQLYIADQISSVSLPERQLRKFQKLFLKRGERQMVQFILADEDFALLNQQLQWVVEPGIFKIAIGSSSQDLPIELLYERK